MRKLILFFLIIIFLNVPCFATQGETEAPEFDTEVFFWRVKEVEVPIVMYHLITERPKYIGKFGITPAQLESDLKYLKEKKYNAIVMQDLINFVNSGTKLPKNPIMLTFDDGNSSDYNYVLPLLKKYNMKAVMAVLGEASDRFTEEAEEKPNAVFPNLTWQQIKELHESGYVEIQNHSYDLHKTNLGSSNRYNEPDAAYRARLRTDLQKFQDACAAHLNYVPTTFVYPLGAIGKNSREVLEEMGMVASISCSEGMNIIRQGDKDCLFMLKRTNRPSNRNIEDVLKSIKKK